MKTLFITIILIFILSSLRAQLYIGPKIGVATSFEDTYNDHSYTDASILSINLEPSINVGAMLMYRFGALSIQWEPMYIVLKGKLNMEDIYDSCFVLEQKRTYWRNNFLLNAGKMIKNRVRLYAQAGLTIGFLLNSERVINEVHYFPYNDIQNKDLGITFGVGALVRIKKNWIEINIRANHGLTGYKYISTPWLGSYYYNSNLSYNIAYIFLISNRNKKTKLDKDKVLY